MSTELELTAPVNLCDEKGRLNPAAVGWSRRPLHACNLRGAWPRKKRWNYWCVTTDQHLFSVTLSDLDYAGMAFAYFLEFETGRFHELTVMTPFGSGMSLPDTVAGSMRFQHAKLACSLTEQAGGVRIQVESSSFGGAPLAADLLVARPAAAESMNVVIPWSQRQFQFTSKQLCLPAAGGLSLGDKAISMDGGLACLDFGRGIWPYNSMWNWGAFSARQAGRSVGVNLGGRWTDGTGYTENAIFVDGRVSKLAEPVDFAYDPRDFKRPWRLRSGRVDLVFEPSYERVARTDMLILRSEVHQLIGRYSGTVVTDAGEPVTVTDAVGWAEEHKARW